MSETSKRHPVYTDTNNAAKLLLSIVAGCLLVSAPAASENTPVAQAAPKRPVTHDERMGWWRTARFGMFIHWGLYSIPGGEWQGKDYGKEAGGASAEWIMLKARIPKEEYARLAQQFNPVKFDAKQWVSLAKEAGMKYMVITSKHHDGFCLFDTRHTEYDIVDATPFKRDVIKELSQECERRGIRFGVYYSQRQDWYHGGRSGKAASSPEYIAMVRNHLRELLTNYGRIGVVWFDTGGSNVDRSDSYGAIVRQLQPRSIICSRLYSRGVAKARRKYADFDSLPDRTIAAARAQGDTETCMTMRHNWGYDRDDNNWKSAKDIIERLVLSASRGANFLLNVGPTPQGELCPQEIERLKVIGKWLKANGDSIYGTTAGPLDFDFPWGAITQKGHTLYLHVMKWNPEGIAFNGLTSTPSKAYLLSGRESGDLAVQHDANTNVTTVTVPAEVPDAMNAVIVLEYDGPVKVDSTATGKYHWIKSTGVKRHGKPGVRRRRGGRK